MSTLIQISRLCHLVEQSLSVHHEQTNEGILFSQSFIQPLSVHQIVELISYKRLLEVEEGLEDLDNHVINFLRIVML